MPGSRPSPDGQTRRTNTRSVRRGPAIVTVDLELMGEDLETYYSDKPRGGGGQDQASNQKPPAAKRPKK